jgi:hypothetical protein
MHQDVENDYRGIEDWTYRAQFVWRPTALMAVTLMGFRDVGTPTQSPTGSNRLISEIGLRVDYEISRDVTLSAATGYDWIDYVDLPRGDEFFRLYGGAEYRIGSLLSVFAQYTFAEYASNAVPDIGYSKNILLLGFRARW